MKKMAKIVFVLLTFLALFVVRASAHAQPAAREFFKQATSQQFNPQTLLVDLGRRAAEPIIEFLQRDPGLSSDFMASNASSALQQLALTGHPKAVEVLARYLKDDSQVAGKWQDSIRREAIAALGVLDIPESHRALGFALTQKANRMFVRDVFKHCGHLRAVECGPFLADYLRQEKSTDSTLLLNLAQCDGGRVVELIQNVHKARSRPFLYEHEFLALGMAGPTAASFLLTEVGNRQKDYRSGAPAVNLAWALGQIQNPKAVPILKELVQGSDPMVIYQAALSLASYHDRESLPLLRAASNIKLSQPEIYQDGGEDSDYGFFRRERIRQADFDLALAYARAVFGDASSRQFLIKAAAGNEPALAVLADGFLLRLGERRAQEHLVLTLEQSAQNGFIAQRTESTWDNSTLESLQALIQLNPEAGFRAGWLLLESTNRTQQEIVNRMLHQIGKQQRLRGAVALLGRGSYQARADIRDKLRMEGEPILPELERAIFSFDLDGRALATALLSEFDDRAGLSVLQKLADTDPAWQVRSMARQGLMTRSKKERSQRPKMASPAKDYLAYLQPDKVPGNPVGAAELKGLVYVAGPEELTSYDGYQWRKLNPSGLCPGSITSLAALGGSLYLFSTQGVSVGEGERFSCREWKAPVVSLAVQDGIGLMLGTNKGLYQFDGRVATVIPGSPERKVTAAARQGSILWVAFELPPLNIAVRSQPILAKTLVSASQPALYRLEQGRFTPVIEPLLSYEGWRIPLDISSIAIGPGNKLYLGCTEGILLFDGKNFDLLGARQGYDARYPVDALAVSPTGAVTALQGPWLDQQDAQGRWRRSLLGASYLENSLLMATRTASSMQRSNGDTWLLAGDFVQYAYKVMPGAVIRVAGEKPPERALPPETLVAAAKAGEWRWDNPDTSVLPPNSARIAGLGKPVEVPAAQLTIEAAAQDPWDYEAVEFQFKLDEALWGNWQKENGILTPLLGEGEHVLQARSRDASGHVDPSPAKFHFTVHTREMAVVRILGGKFQSVFPSQYRRYEREGMGQVEVENRATEPIQLKINLRVRDLFDSPSTKTISLPPGAKKNVSLAAPFNDRLLSLSAGAEVQAVVEAEFEFEGVQRQVRQAFPVKILAANAFDWAEPTKITGFINSSDPLVERFAAEVYLQFSKSGGAAILPMRNLALAAYLFRALDAYGVSYKPDPQSPFGGLRPGTLSALDTIRFPSQTLQQKTGDCDDLTVLYASLLEQVDIRTVVIPVEGHVFLMFDTGVTADNRASFAVPDMLLVEREGTLWAPVEETFLGRKGASFEGAWSAGAEGYHHRYKIRPELLVNVRQAWMDTPPATLSLGPLPPLSPEIAAAGEPETKNILAGYRQAILAKAPSGNDPTALLGRARLLISNGLFSEAEPCLQEANRQKPSFEALYALGVLHAGKREAPQAASAFEKASQLTSEPQLQFKASIALAATFRSAGQLERAQSACDQALKLNPAARFDSKYASLIQFLRSAEKTKASGDEGPPPFFQLLLANM